MYHYQGTRRYLISVSGNKETKRIREQGDQVYQGTRRLSVSGNKEISVSGNKETKCIREQGDKCIREQGD